MVNWLVSSKTTKEENIRSQKIVLHKGKNNIAILVLNFFDKGGVYGYKDTTKHIGIYPVNNEEAKISLNGQWKYLVQNDNPPPVGAYQASYQPFGDLNLIFPNTAGATNYKENWIFPTQ
jgi:alpha-L-fucosidase 2